MRASTLALLAAAWLLCGCERKKTPALHRASSGEATRWVLPPSDSSCASPAPAPALGADEDIRRVAPGKYAVSRRLFDEWTQGCRLTLERGPTVKPFERDGRTIGVQLTNLKPSGWLSQLGLREGDVLTDVNGQALSSSQRFLELYAQGRSQASFELGMLRNGQRLAQSYEIRAR